MDKVQKIREEIGKKLEMMQYQVHRKDAYKELKDVLAYIDSLQEELVSDNIISVIDKQAKRLWNEINTGHEYSIIDSYNQFYGICMEIAESIKEEPVSEDLEEAAKHYLYSNILYNDVYVGEPTDKDCIEMFKAGAKWQKEQIMKDTINTVVHIDAGNYPYIPQIELYDYDNDIPLAKKGEKVKVIVIRED